MGKNTKPIFWISLIGVLFAGYLLLTKLLSKTCALAEGCTYLFGLPTCVYGFTMYLVIFIFAAMEVSKVKVHKNGIKITAIIGVVFSLCFTIYEIFFSPNSLISGARYTLGLPSCTYGLVMFIAILVLSMKNK